MSLYRLNPCPFCGHRPEPDYARDSDSDGLAVLCQVCSAQGPFLHPVTAEECLTEAEARVAWNCRAAMRRT